MNDTRRKPTTGRQSPSLFESTEVKQIGVLYRYLKHAAKQGNHEACCCTFRLNLFLNTSLRRGVGILKLKYKDISGMLIANINVRFLDRDQKTWAYGVFNDCMNI